MADPAKCVLCGTTENVYEFVWLWRYGVYGPKETDLCEGCMQKLVAPVLPSAKISRRKNTRPQVRREKTEIGPENL